MKVLSDHEYSTIMHRLGKVEQMVSEVQKSPEETFFDNQQFLQVMNISKRTAQTWRNEQIIPYSQVGNKIYYKYSDILELIEENYNPVKKKFL